MSFKSRKPKAYGNSKQKWLCDYEYLCRKVNISSHTNKLEVWRCTVNTGFFLLCLKEEMCIMMSSVNFKVGKTCGIHPLQSNTPCVAFSCTTCIVFSPTIFGTCVAGNSDTSFAGMTPSLKQRRYYTQLAYLRNGNHRSFRIITRADPDVAAAEGCFDSCQKNVKHLYDTVWSWCRPSLREATSGLDLILYNFSASWIKGKQQTMCCQWQLKLNSQFILFYFILQVL